MDKEGKLSLEGTNHYQEAPATTRSEDMPTPPENVLIVLQDGVRGGDNLKARSKQPQSAS